MPDVRFDGRVVVVTGAGRGLGRAHALYLAARGAKVLVNDVGSSIAGEGANEGPSQAVVDEISAAGSVAASSVDDVATVEGAACVVATAIEQFGSVDIVINNAGIITYSEFAESTSEDFINHLMVHLAGSFNVTRAAWPHLVLKGYGRIVMTTSSALFGKATLVSYATAKAGEIGLTKSLALAGRDKNIKVNAIAPIAKTRMVDENSTRSNGEIVPGAPEYVSAAVALLVHESCPVSGEVVGAGAGRVARLFVADTVGYTDRDLTPEGLRDHWPEVMDETGYYTPIDAASHSEGLRNPDLAGERS